MKNCFEGYLTQACATCPDWADGTDDRGIGCACHFPIMECEHFAKMFEEEAQKERKTHVCKNCFHYNIKSKACDVICRYTARKNTCIHFYLR